MIEIFLLNWKTIIFETIRKIMSWKTPKRLHIILDNSLMDYLR